MNKYSDNINALKKICLVVCSDLGLFASLCLARFIVWHTLRARQKEQKSWQQNSSVLS